MPNTAIQLLKLYVQLGGGVLLGWILGRLLPKIVPTAIGQFLFWVGVPISIFTFLRGADLSGAIWIAPVTAWVAILSGAGLAWGWMRWRQIKWIKPTQGSFLLASMVGNTGYLGFPVTLALVGEKYFAWAIFYDLLGTTVGAQGLGVILAARYGMGASRFWQLIGAVARNPASWSLLIGMGVRTYPLPLWVEQGLKTVAWGMVALSLVLIGMRLSQLDSWKDIRPAAVSLAIKMLVIPLVLGLGLLQLGVTGSPQLAIVLQMATPPAFATLVIAEAYNLDRNLAVTALFIGTTGFLFTLPMWLLLFG